MGQVTIYLDEERERRMRLAASDAGQPVSRWVAALIDEKTRSEWPQAVVELAGQFQDFPTLDELRADQSADMQREPL